MIDWHAHILPGMDDGSGSPQESAALLQMLSQQGVDTVIASPHFYADRESVAQFLHRRKEARAHVPDISDAPEIRCGAEVYYYPGISRLPQLEELCIEGSDLLLLEMPHTRWTEFIVREVEELSRRSRLTLILAHVERYMDMQSPETWERLHESEILMQISADAFQPFWQRHRMLSLLRTGKVHLIGSDCHNLTLRPPAMDRAEGAMRKKLGEDFFSQFCEEERRLLAGGSDR